MRRIYFIILLAGIFMVLAAPVKAQVSVGINFNLGSQPIWGPVGNDYVEYYYLPDIETYYSVPQRRYYYFENGIWIGRSTLPVRYSSYNIYNSYKVVLNEPNPWKNHKNFKEKYYSYAGRHDQQIIRDTVFHIPANLSY